MARWNNLDDAELLTRTVYVGAYGFRDSDSLGRVWAHTPKQFDRMMARAIRETIALFRSDGGSAIGMWYVGPFEETVQSLADDMEEPGRLAEMLDDIRSSPSGYVF